MSVVGLNWVSQGPNVTPPAPPPPRPPQWPVGICGKYCATVLGPPHQHCIGAINTASVVCTTAPPYLRQEQQILQPGRPVFSHPHMGASRTSKRLEFLHLLP